MSRAGDVLVACCCKPHLHHLCLLLLAVSHASLSMLCRMRHILSLSCRPALPTLLTRSTTRPLNPANTDGAAAWGAG